MPRKKQLVVYSSHTVSTGTLIPRLKESFYQALIRKTGPDDLHKPGLLGSDTLAFFLPGIIGEKSPYNTEIGPAGNAAIRRYVENGGVFVGICAGAYYACRDILYDPPWLPQPKTSQPGLDFFNALAKGPLPGFALHGDEAWYSDCTVTTISYQDSQDTRAVTGIAYGNGPMLIPDDDEEIEILARYEDVPGRPIAIAAKRIGKGLALFVGVLPYVGYEPHNPALCDEEVKNLLESLRPHESGRENVWDMIVSRIKLHNADLGRVNLLPGTAGRLQRQPAQ